MAADRAQHVDEVIRPALAEGRWVVTDRYSGSTLAYQGVGAGPGHRRRSAGWWPGPAGGVEPDLSVLVDVDPEVARQRLAGAAPDRLERLDAGFHERVRHGFVALARADEEHWAVVDGSGQVTTVAAKIAQVVHERLGRPA